MPVSKEVEVDGEETSILSRMSTSGRRSTARAAGFFAVVVLCLSAHGVENFDQRRLRRSMLDVVFAFMNLSVFHGESDVAGIAMAAAVSRTEL